MTGGIVIVGAGYCGTSAAIAARDTGYDDSITVIGDEQARPYERPPLSKWQGTSPIERPIFAPDVFVEKDINLRLGEKVTAINRDQSTLRLQSGQMLGYHRLLLATGARARQIDPQTWPQVNLRYLRSLRDAQSLSKDIRPGAHVMIIGGGFIGLELAATLTALQAQIHVIEVQNCVLARAVPQEISRRVQQLHATNGVTIHSKTTISSFVSDVATLSNGQRLKAEHVIVGIGSVPNTELAKSVGLVVDNGIVVDEGFATTDPTIFAAGDCCTSPMGTSGNMRLESWQVAGDQGRRAGQIIAGGQPEMGGPPWFWSDQFDHSLQVVGVSGPQPDCVIRSLSNGAILTFNQNGSGQITNAAGFGPGNSIARDVKLAQKIMEAKITVRPDVLADPYTSLKTILKGR
jgi:3-phenylpropionate/trans-cinnamate dioxygenase ferredoxin reductase subunit